MKAYSLLQWAYSFMKIIHWILGLWAFGYAVSGAMPLERLFGVCCAGFKLLLQNITPCSSL